MIHLFNNVFLEQDTYLNTLDTCIVVSKEYGGNVYNTKSIIAAAETLTPQSVIQLGFTKNEKVTIYADTFHFAQIATHWLKSTVNFDQDSFDVWVDCYNHTLEMYGKQNTQLAQIMKDSFEDTEEGDYSHIDYMPSYEFLIASVFADSGSSHKSKLKTLMSKMIKREYEDTILECRRHIDILILDNDLQELLGGSGKTIKNYKELPGMKPFVNNCWNNRKSIEIGKAYVGGAGSKLDISNGTEKEVKELVDIVQKVTSAIYGDMAFNQSGTGIQSPISSEMMFKYLDSVYKGELTDEEFESALQEILDEKIALIYLPFTLGGSIVLPFVTYIRSLKQEDELDKLAKFTIK